MRHNLMRHVLPPNLSGKTFPGEYNATGIPRRANLFYATGEYRSPKAGEYYLSGAIIEAYRAPNDLSSKYWIAAPVVQIDADAARGTRTAATTRAECGLPPQERPGVPSIWPPFVFWGDTRYTLDMVRESGAVYLSPEAEASVIIFNA